MRPTRVQTFMEVAHVVAKRATCMRLNVGAVVVHNRKIVSFGYNGAPSGEPHCAGNNCEGKHRCTLTIHAEKNALDHMPAGIHGPLDVYVTDSPCYDCWQYMQRQFRNSDGSYAYVNRVFFSTPYRITDHLEGDEPFDGSLPEVYRVLPAGYILNWRTKDLVEVDT